MEALRELVQQKPYDRTSIAKLEEFVASAVKNEQYDFEIVKSLLKLYGVYPEEIKIDVVANVLVLALMRLPSTDFLNLACLVPHKLQKKEPLKSIFTCADHLDRCQFVEFWTARNAEGTSALFGGVKGFDAAVRVFALSCVQATCRNISTEKLQAILGFTAAADFSGFIKGNSSIEQGAGAVISFAALPASATGNTTKQGHNVKYENVIRHMEMVQ